MNRFILSLVVSASTQVNATQLSIECKVWEGDGVAKVRMDTITAKTIVNLKTLSAKSI